ncbi:MAG: MarR family transcriptional regulator [Lentisphaeria bacterium]|nr:MarR family transcriptional regulator [Lentisphaeria bacterium]
MNNTELKNEQIWRNLLRLADRLGSSGVSECDLPSRLPLSQLRVVGVIYDRYPAGVMLKEIADELKLTPGAISQTVDVLVRENIVERTVSPADRRAVLLKPTDEGLKLKEQHSLQVENVMQAISKNVKPEEFATFAKVLEHLLEQIVALQIPNSK